MDLKKPKETDLVRQCLDWLRCKCIFAWRNNTGAFAGTYRGKKRLVRFGVPGASDIIGLLPGGRFLAVECKMPGKKLTEEQDLFLDGVRLAGGLAVVAYSLDELRAALEGVA